MSEDTQQSQGLIETDATIENTEESVETLDSAEGAQEEGLAAAPEVEVEGQIEEASPKKEQPKSEEDKKFAAKFAALARREKLVKQAEVKAAKRERELEARIKQLEEQNKPKQEAAPEVEPLDIRIKKNPFKTLEEMGLGYETLTRMALNDGKMTPELESQLMKQELESKMEKHIKSLEAKLEAMEKSKKEEAERAEKEAAEKQQTAAISQFKSEIGQLIAGDKEAYELLGVEGDEGIEAVYNEVAEDAMKKRQEAEELGDDPDSIELLSIQEAAQRVEDRLLNEAKKRVELGKIKKLLGASPQTTPSKEPVKKSASVTLSNNKQQAQGTKRAFLSDEESKKEAAKFIRWNKD